MENRRVMPPLSLEKAIDPKYVRTTTPEENAKIDAAKASRKKFDEGKAKAQGAYKQILKEGAMKRSYTIDEMTVATLLKGHPDAHEIVDSLFKGKEKNESGEEFQDGSEDTIGGEGHAAVARPDSIKHEGKPSGIGPNEPGTGTKKASVEDGDLEKTSRHRKQVHSAAAKEDMDLAFEYDARADTSGKTKKQQAEEHEEGKTVMGPEAVRGERQARKSQSVEDGDLEKAEGDEDPKAEYVPGKMNENTRRKLLSDGSYAFQYTGNKQAVTSNTDEKTGRSSSHRLSQKPEKGTMQRESKRKGESMYDKPHVAYYTPKSDKKDTGKSLHTTLDNILEKAKGNIEKSAFKREETADDKGNASRKQIDQYDEGEHGGYSDVSETKWKDGKQTSTPRKRYYGDSKTGTVRAFHPDAEKMEVKEIPANAAHEKELKNASQDDFDLEKAIDIVGDFLMEKGYDIDETNEIIEDYFGLEKSDNLADNLPDEFEDEMEDDDTIPAEENAEKSLTADEETLGHLLKTMGSERMEEILKAVIGGASIDPSKRRMLAQMPGAYKDPKSSGEDNPLTNRQINPKALAALKQGVGSGGATKSEESDLEKSEENMGEDYSLDFSKSILERMGLQKGATSVSKEAGGGKATQINYGTKPTTRFKHPKAKSDKKYIHNPAKGTVTVEKEGEKTREIDVSDEKKLKNASVSSADLYKSLDAILEKKTLEKGRKRESDRSAPKRVQESEGEGVELPGGSMATMGNPGGSKEKASFERAEPGAIKNLKKLAESPNKMDRKAAEAGLKRH